MSIEKYEEPDRGFRDEGDVIDAEVVPRSTLALRRAASGAKAGTKALSEAARRQAGEVFPQVTEWVRTEKLDDEDLRKLLPEHHRQDAKRLELLRRRRLTGRIALAAGTAGLLPWALATQPFREVVPLFAMLGFGWVYLLVKARKKPQTGKAAKEEKAKAKQGSSEEPQEASACPPVAQATEKDREEPQPPMEAPHAAPVPAPEEPGDTEPEPDVATLSSPEVEDDGTEDVSTFSDPEPAEPETTPPPAETLDNAKDEQWLEGLLRTAKALNADQRIEIYSPLRRVNDHAREVAFRVHGGTADQVRAKASSVASELDIHRNWLDLRQDRTEGRVSMWWAHEDPLVTHRSPILDATTWDVFDGAPLGRDRRGDEVRLDLTETSMIFGGAQNFGKTSGMYAPACAYLLDPRTERWLYDFKGGGDWTPMVPLCARSQIGATEGVVDAFLSDLGRLRNLIEERFAQLREMGANKLTPEMASTGVMKPLLVVIDEIEALFLLLSTREDGTELIKEISNTLALAIKRARAVCINVMFSGQRPAGRQVDTGLRDSAMQRICVHTSNKAGSEMVLGDQAREAGLTAAGLGVPGRAVLVKPGGVTLLQTGYIALEDFEALCHRVLAAKPKEIPARGVSELAAVLLRAMGERDKLSLDQVRQVLADHDPEQWGQKPEQSQESYERRVGYLMSRHGIRTSAGANLADGRRGRVVRKADLLNS